MPTRGHEGHEMVKIEGVPQGTPSHKRDAEHPGYEVQDVNVGGIITFLGGLAGSIIVFFFLCFGMGKLINLGILKQDGAAPRNAVNLSQPGVQQGKGREDLASNAEMEQRQLQQMTKVFPTPQLQTDDGNQEIYEMHAREDLLLNFYSSSKDAGGGAIRIPIERAMELVVQRGLGTPAAAQQPKQLMAGESSPAVASPLTNGFARTGYELDQMEAREQRLQFNNAEKSEK